MYEKDRIYIPYLEAKPLIKDADLFLYRGDAWYSFFIKRASRGEYSHAGLASWNDNILESIEFHGWRGGGATFNADNLFPEYTKQIDVYRVSDYIEIINYNKEFAATTYNNLVLDRKCVCQTMRNLTGLPYGWRRIFWFIKSYLFGLRFCYDLEDLTSDELEKLIYPVCSTAIAYSFNKCGFKLLHQLADEWTQPSNLANSPLTNYLFTIV
jgi:hypothetical protein